jgi:cytoskeleton protein RodZ
MGSVASELKSEREKRKITLAQIAAETRISLRYLESLEEGRFKDLPGGIYNRAFLRAYCETLKLDNLEEILKRYEGDLTPSSEKTVKSKIYLPPRPTSFHISPLLIWGIMLLFSATGLFFSRNWITTIFSPYFSHTPAAVVPYEPVQAKPIPSPTAKAEPATESPAPPVSVPPATSETSPAPAAPSLVTQPPAREPAKTAATEVKIVPPTSPPSATPSSSQSLRLEIDATAVCWVSVDKDGSPVFRKTMQPGEIQLVGAGEKFQIILGNAGGVNIKINGKPARPLGRPGEVVKFTIDAGKLQELLEQAAG